MDPLISALIGLAGALVGSLASITTIFIQSHYQSRRDRMKIVVEMATAAHQWGVETVKQSGGGFVPPLSLYLDYHASIARIIERRPLTVDDLRTLSARQQDLMDASPLSTEGYKRKPAVSE